MTATEASILSEKLRRYGTVGAGIITDSMATLRLAEAASQAASANAPQGSGRGYPASVQFAPAAADDESEEVWVWVKPTGEGPYTRQEILDILRETVRVQGIVQKEVSALARKIAKEKVEGKKKKKQISLLDGYKRIKELDLPKEPLEELGLSETAFQKLLMEYEEDEEVMTKAQELVHPAGKGDPARAKSITIDKIIEIHQFMVAEMQKVLTEFLQLDQETRRTFTSKACETTAELLVSIAVEQQLSVHCEDVEQAVIRYETMLQGNQEFARCTEQLAGMMQHLTSAAQPRVDKADFIEVLRHMAEGAQKAKVFAKKLYEDYRAKTCNVSEAYKRFEEFVDNSKPPREGLEDMSPVELQLCYDEYRDDAEVKEAWSQSGVENNLMMTQSMAAMMKPGGTPSSGSSGPEDKKGKKTKPSDIVEMQELMVDELKRTSEAAAAATKASATAWRTDIAMQMVQALASAAVERRYGVSAEEMTMAGFQNAVTLQKNERFVRATEKQQEILMNVARMCEGATQSQEE